MATRMPSRRAAERAVGLSGGLEAIGRLPKRQGLCSGWPEGSPSGSGHSSHTSRSDSPRRSRRAGKSGKFVCGRHQTLVAYTSGCLRSLGPTTAMSQSKHAVPVRTRAGAVALTSAWRSQCSDARAARTDVRRNRTSVARSRASPPSLPTANGASHACNTSPHPQQRRRGRCYGVPCHPPLCAFCSRPCAWVSWRA